MKLYQLIRRRNRRSRKQQHRDPCEFVAFCLSIAIIIQQPMSVFQSKMLKSLYCEHAE